ncbi:MAG: hypothetical protein HZA77_08775 [Candidatus Schekmanbacteria bacterium]|nr:hypothetical protein [Candidatus Schekmanbacteria bacterium]
METHCDLKVGMFVTHDKFGRGRILKIHCKENDTVIEVSFVNYGTRKLSLNNTKFLKVEEE